MQKIDGIVDIETDVAKRTCSFKVTDPTVNYQSTLAELAETNTHLAGYKIL